jgi:Bacterial SH3 domain
MAPWRKAVAVTDPAGTPLNVRATPNGAVVDKLPNGTLVAVIDNATNGGKSWVYVSEYESGRRIGWTFREFISCF